ncbi:MAG: right-handed parallel beta-helix repeat-containing protein [Candidatus Hydrogenedentes bacterium]|nr:right-handed parallel beta-helix repeat-containing protein [Candidatus Hydrogenedentota bacterium]
MFFSLLLVSVGLLGGNPEVNADFAVSPGGDDANAGTLEAPFATLEAVQKAVRARIADAPRQNVTVVLREGTYTLAEPLRFGPEDGGTDKRRVTYRAYPGESVVFSGGRAITGWEKQAGNRWSVTLPEAVAGEWRFRDLYADGERLSRGRFPNYPELMRVAGVSEDLTGIVLNTSPGVENLAGASAELVMYQNWSISRVIVASSNDRTLKMANPMGWVGHGDYTSASTNKPAYLENALAFVDAPGEWYLDYASGLLTYQAAEGEDPNTREFIAPYSDQLIAVEGAPENPVRNLHFEGITFEHSRWDLPEFGYLGIQAGHYGTRIEEPTFVLPAAILFLYAEDCTVNRCAVRHTGSGGIAFGAGARGNRVERCTLADIGGNGIMVGWRGVGSMTPQSPDEDRHLSADWSRPEDVPLDNVITGNLIERCGAVNHGCVGIFDAFAKRTEITQNLVRDMPYTGISSGFRWNETETSQRETLIAHNHVHDVMKMLADGGALYTLGFQPGARIIGNVFHGVHRSAFAHGGAPNNGIFFDQGSKGFHVERNTIYDTSGDAIRFNQTNKENMTWEANQFGIGAE